MMRLARLWASGLGSGYLPAAPGTWGSLAALLALIMLRWSGIFSPTIAALPPWGVHFSTGHLVELLALVLLCISGWWATQKVIPIWGKDPSRVVIDEWAGIWVSLLWIPMTALNFALGFLLFRLLDIYKPFGIRKAEQLSGATGVMMDDILAGLLTNVLLWLFLTVLAG